MKHLASRSGWTRAACSKWRFGQMHNTTPADSPLKATRKEQQHDAQSSAP